MGSILDKYTSTGVIEIDFAAFKANSGDPSKVDTGKVVAVFVDEATGDKEIVVYPPETAISTPYLNTHAGTWFAYEKNGTITPEIFDLERDEFSSRLKVFRLSHFARVGQRPVNVTGVSLYNPTGTDGTFDLVYTFSGQTLSWGGGTPVAIGGTATGTYTLDAGSGNTVQVDVRKSALPISDQTDSSLPTSGVGIITGVFVLPIMHSQDLDVISETVTEGTRKISGLEVEVGGTDLSLKRLVGISKRIGAGESIYNINLPNLDEATGYTALPAWLTAVGTAGLGAPTTQLPTDYYAGDDGVLTTADDGFYVAFYEVNFPSYDYETSSKRTTNFWLAGFKQYNSLQSGISGVGGDDIKIPIGIDGGQVTAVMIVKKGVTNLTEAIEDGDAFVLPADADGNFPEQYIYTPVNMEAFLIDNDSTTIIRFQDTWQFMYTTGTSKEWYITRADQISLDTTDGTLISESVRSIIKDVLTRPTIESTGTNREVEAKSAQMPINGTEVTFDNATNTLTVVSGSAPPNGTLITFYYSVGTIPAALFPEVVYYTDNASGPDFQIFTNFRILTSKVLAAFADNGTGTNIFDVVTEQGDSQERILTSGTPEVFNLPSAPLVNFGCKNKTIVRVNNTPMNNVILRKSYKKVV